MKRNLLETEPETNYPDNPTKRLKTDPLYNAVSRGNLEEVKDLIKNGAEKNLTDTNGKTLLHKAIIEGGIKSGCLEVAVYLINEGTQDHFHFSHKALHLAASNCMEKVLQAFVDNNHDLTVKTQDILHHNVIDLILSSRNSEDMMLESLRTIPQNQIDILLAQSSIDKNNLDDTAKNVLKTFSKEIPAIIEISNLTQPLEEKQNLDNEPLAENTLPSDDILTGLQSGELSGLLGDTYSLL
jgi:ankyrin repeat protein